MLPVFIAHDSEIEIKTEETRFIKIKKKKRHTVLIKSFRKCNVV